MNFKKRWKEDIRVDITPLIDVVFILLLFFIVTTTFVVAPGITVELPKSKSVEIKREKKELRVVITKEKQIFLNARKITLPELSRELLKYAKVNKDAVVILQADENVNHGTVVTIMDTAKSAGLHRLAIATNPEKETIEKN